MAIWRRRAEAKRMSVSAVQEGAVAGGGKCPKEKGTTYAWEI